MLALVPAFKTVCLFMRTALLCKLLLSAFATSAFAQTHADQKIKVLVLTGAPRDITEAQKARFLALFDKGIGVVVLHHAYLAYPMWPEFGRIAGGQYVYTEGQMAGGLASSHYQG